MDMLCPTLKTEENSCRLVSVNMLLFIEETFLKLFKI